MNGVAVYYIVTGVAALVGAILGLRSYITRSRTTWASRIKEDQEHVTALKECTKAIAALTTRLDFTSTTLSNYGERITRLEWQGELAQNAPKPSQHPPGT
jgi:hypothetical protein